MANLVSLAVPTTVDLSSQIGSLTFTGAVTDGAAVSELWVWFEEEIDYSFSATSASFGNWDGTDQAIFILYDFIDTFADGTSSYTFGIDPTTPSGDYHIAQVDIVDDSGNRNSYIAAQLEELGINTTISFTGTGSSQVVGTAGNDVLNGTAGDDAITGLGGNDTIFPGLGNDSIDGGTGTDTVRLTLFPNEYQFTLSGTNQYTVDYLNYSTVLNNVEFVEFGTVGAEHTTRLAIADLASGEVQANLAYLTDLYLAFFGRAPDVSGLEYWQEQLLETGRDFATISKDFSWSTEAQALFPSEGSNRDFVQTVYQNCFGRNPDQGGWDYWTNKLNQLDPQDPEYLNDRGAFVGELLLGAYAPTSGEEDRSLLTNRHEVALEYVNKLSAQPQEGFDAAINDLLAMVNMDAATQAKAEHVIDHVFNNPIGLTGVMNNAGLLADLWAEG